MAKGSEWVRVKSEDELRAGITVEVRPCRWCGQKDRYVLLRDKGSSVARTADGLLVESRMFSVPGTCVRDGWRRDVTGFAVAIRDGRLFRLADDQLIDLSETRELENVR